MMKKLTAKWLENNNACSEAVEQLVCEGGNMNDRVKSTMLKWFESLSIRDFENGAVRDEIALVFIDRDRLREQLAEKERQSIYWNERAMKSINDHANAILKRKQLESALAEREKEYENEQRLRKNACVAVVLAQELLDKRDEEGARYVEGINNNNEQIRKLTTANEKLRKQNDFLDIESLKLKMENEELRKEVEGLTNQLAEEETNTNFYINGYADLKEKLVAEIELSRAAGEAYHLMKIRAERAERELGELKSK